MKDYQRVSLIKTKKNCPLSIQARYVYSHLLYQLEYNSYCDRGQLAQKTGVEYSKGIPKALGKLAEHGLLAHNEEKYLLTDVYHYMPARPTAEQMKDWFYPTKTFQTWWRSFQYHPYYVRSTTGDLTFNNVAVYSLLRNFAVNRSGLNFVESSSASGLSVILKLNYKTITASLVKLQQLGLLQMFPDGARFACIVADPSHENCDSFAKKGQARINEGAEAFFAKLEKEQQPTIEEEIQIELEETDPTIEEEQQIIEQEKEQIELPKPKPEPKEIEQEQQTEKQQTKEIEQPESEDAWQRMKEEKEIEAMLEEQSAGDHYHSFYNDNLGGAA